MRSREEEALPKRSFPGLAALKTQLEALYERYNRAEFREKDPVSVVWAYAEPADQEVAGLWAALFAWGRREVAIQKARLLLESVGPHPAAALREGQPLAVSLRHRTWSPTDIAALWSTLGNLYRRYGRLEAFFYPYRQRWEEGIAAFQEAILSQAPSLRRHIGYIRAGSASKRLQLWLRWMVRRDAVDPGPWEGFNPAVLFVPVDVHIARWATEWGLLPHRPPTWKQVLTLTAFFRQLSPTDPLRYDFALVTAQALLPHI
ncbi:MAG: TIGR02757 family protein [Bacteroidetes bacterium]|nr:MAG: TIGR02757 family protein [Bacteroidota bacterium]